MAISCGLWNACHQYSRTLANTVPFAYRPGMAHEREGDHLIPTVQLWPHSRRGPWRVALSWQVQHGRAEVIGMDIRSAATEPMFLRPPRKVGIPLTSGVLRSLKFGQMAERDRADLSEIFRPAELYTPRGGGRPTADPDRLRRVAEEYLQAWSAGEPTGKAVAAAEAVDGPQARKLIWSARRAGLLPTTKPGVAIGGKRKRKS
jgi:hypothetical protein